jgi:hypothetical protein
LRSPALPDRVPCPKSLAILVLLGVEKSALRSRALTAHIQMILGQNHDPREYWGLNRRDSAIVFDCSLVGGLQIRQLETSPPPTANTYGDSFRPLVGRDTSGSP